MNTNTSINEMMVTSTQDYLKSDKLKKYIEKQTENMINESIKDALGWNGKIKKQVDEAIKQELHINMKELGIAGHNKFITEIIAKKFKQYLRTEAAEKINKSIDKILDIKEKDIKIEEFIKVLRSFSSERNSCDCIDSEDYDEYIDIDDEVTFIVEKDITYKWINIYCDTRPNISEYNCEFQLIVHENFTSFKIKGIDFKATDVMLDYQFDFEDYLYQLFLNNCHLNYDDLFKY